MDNLDIENMILSEEDEEEKVEYRYNLERMMPLLGACGWSEKRVMDFLMYLCTGEQEYFDKTVNEE